MMVDVESIIALGVVPKGILARLVVRDGCWSWNGECRKQDARPIFNKQYVYRILYEYLIGPIPNAHILHHRECNHKWCANPWHTVPLTQKEHLKEHGINGDNGGQSGKTHCPSGHAYDRANTVITKNGERLCRECLRIRASKRYYDNLELNRRKSREYQRRRNNDAPRTRTTARQNVSPTNR